MKLITGYKVGNKLGEYYESNGLTLDIIDMSNCNNVCKGCYFNKNDKCENSDKGKCLNLKYNYQKHSLKKNKDKLKVIDLDSLSRSCKDFCIYYRENCYLDKGIPCVLRLIESYGLPE